MENIVYDITCSREKFDALKMDDRFLCLLTLARVVNGLRFCQKAAINARNATTPGGARSRINSFLFASSVLYEGFILVEHLGKNYKNLDSFKNGFGVLLRDKTAKLMRESVLKRMRNKFVFHFDQEVAKESLKNFELQEYKFASGIGKARIEIYFGLADEVVINYLLQPTHNEPDESVKQRFEKILQDTADVMNKFTESAEKLMAEALDGMGFTIKINK